MLGRICYTSGSIPCSEWWLVILLRSPNPVNALKAAFRHRSCANVARGVYVGN